MIGNGSSFISNCNNYLVLSHILFADNTLKCTKLNFYNNNNDVTAFSISIPLLL